MAGYFQRRDYHRIIEKHLINSSMKNPSPAVSIIVPVFNTEKHICRCLNSIKSQTYNNFEVIIVDDGSSDNSGAICDKYAANDNRFRVIHKENGGVSTARQTGLENANGEFIIHIDSDDWIESNMIQELIETADKEKADMVICDFFEESNNNSHYASQNLYNPITAKEVQSKIINTELLGNCWNKLTRKACCKDISFSPTNVSLGEDMLFNVKILCNDIKIYYLPKAYYHYGINQPTSITRNINLQHILKNRQIVINELCKIINKEEFNNFHNLKKNVLDVLFYNKNLNNLKTTYTEIHPDIINNNKKYRPLAPLGYFMAMALKGHAYTAYYLYKINIFTIKFIQRIRKIFYLNSY